MGLLTNPLPCSAPHRRGGRSKLVAGQHFATGVGRLPGSPRDHEIPGAPGEPMVIAYPLALTPERTAGSSSGRCSPTSEAPPTWTSIVGVSRAPSFWLLRRCPWGHGWSRTRSGTRRSLSACSRRRGGTCLSSCTPRPCRSPRTYTHDIKIRIHLRSGHFGRIREGIFGASARTDGSNPGVVPEGLR